jgi:PAS domain S-box-containing protein
MGAGRGLRLAYRESVDRERRTDAILQAVAGNVLDSIFCKDLQRRYTFVNAAMARMLGRSVEDLLGKTPEEVFNADDARVVRQVDERNLAGGNIDETRVLTIGALERVFHTVQVPIRDPKGRVTGLCGVVRDVTEMVKAQAELKRHRRILAQQVREKTAELTKARDLLVKQIEDLVSMRKALDTAGLEARAQISRDLHDGVGQMLAGMGYKASALKSALARRRSPLAKDALQIEALARDAIREIKRITRGVIPMELAEEGLAVALGSFAQRTSALGKVTCICQCCTPLPDLDVAMAFELYQIVKEAVSNALQHAEAGRIDIRIAPVAGEGAALQLEVSDDGKGFTPARSRGGAGLELMHHRATNIGGLLSVQSAPGRGTKVACRFVANGAGTAAI